MVVDHNIQLDCSYISLDKVIFNLAYQSYQTLALMSSFNNFCCITLSNIYIPFITSRHFKNPKCILLQKCSSNLLILLWHKKKKRCNFYKSMQLGKSSSLISALWMKSLPIGGLQPVTLIQRLDFWANNPIL